jgi:hypothetical protein
VPRLRFSGSLEMRLQGMGTMLGDVHMLVLAALSDGSAASLEEIAARLGVEAGVIE